MCDNLKLICSYIELLTKKELSDKKCDGKFTDVDMQLKSRIEVVLQRLSTDKSLHLQIENLSPALLTAADDKSFDIRWTFIEWCLVFLILLCSNERASHHCDSKKKQQSTHPAVFSISEEKTVLAAVQFIVALGMAPSLLRGVGIPLHKRSQLGTSLLESQNRIAPQQKHHRLVVCTVTILKCVSQSSLQSIILRYHFIDILSALLQLCYAPIKKITSESLFKDTSSKKESVMNYAGSMDNCPSLVALLKRVRDSVELSEEKLIEEMWEDRNYLTYELEKLVTISYKPLLVSTLFQLQGARAAQVKPSTPSVPKWMRQACGMLLSKELIKPQGIFSVIEGLILTAGSEGESEGTEKWKKYEAMGKIIAHIPCCSPSAEEYYETISLQILSLLQAKGMEANKVAYWITLSTISYMAEHKPVLTQKYILNPLLKPLKLCLASVSANPLGNEASGLLVADEKELAQTVENLYKITLCGFNLSLNLYTGLVSVFVPLFNLLCFTMEGIFHLRQKVEDIVTALLKSSDDPSQLLLAALFDAYLPEEEQVMRTDIKFEYGEEACIKIVRNETSSFCNEDAISENIRKCSCGMYILQALNDKKLTCKLFFCLLQELQEVVKEPESNNSTAQSRSTLLEVDAENSLQIIKLHKNLLLLQLIQEIAEQYGDIIVEDSSQAIEFVQSTLDRCTCFYKQEDAVLEAETISLVLGALAMLVSQKDKLKPNDWAKLKNTIPSLQRIVLNYQDDIKAIAQELLTIIATHGAAGWDMLHQPNSKDIYENIVRIKEKKKGEEHKSFESEKSIKGETSSDRNQMHGISAKADQNIPEKNQNLVPEKEDKASSYQEALKELDDVLLPVQGHALIELKRLILSQDPETLENSDKLINIFTEFLSDTDSYIFLPAIQCLSALGTVYPDKIIPILSAQFSQTDRPYDLKIKVAEALMYVIRALGDLTPKYRDSLLPLFLCGTKDTDPQIRSSSLSNLGELCQRLKYALGPYLQEILICIQSYLKTDSSIEVRRAAVLTLSLLLRGLGSDSLKILEEEMRDLYRLLRLCYNNETDDIVKLHIQIALEEINTFMKENLCQQQPLVKHIKVLNP